MGKRSFFLFFIPFMFSYVTSAVTKELKTSISQSQFTVGDKISFTVSANVTKGAQFVLPPEQSFGKIAIKDWNIQKSEKPDFDSILVQYVITSYTPENCTIPSLQFLIKSAESIDTLYTSPQALQILSVINQTDSSIDIKSLRNQQIAGKAPLFWLWFIIVAAIITVLIFLSIHLGKKTRKTEKILPPKPPYEEAIEALAILHGKRYLQQGLIKEYSFELTEIFKRYIGRRFEVNAEEYTTEEMTAWLGVSGLEIKLRNNLEWFFRTTDLVKFAKYQPDNSTVERFGKEVTDFLEITRPQLTEDKPSDQNTHAVTQESQKKAADDSQKKEISIGTGVNK